MRLSTVEESYDNYYTSGGFRVTLCIRSQHRAGRNHGPLAFVCFCAGVRACLIRPPLPSYLKQKSYQTALPASWVMISIKPRGETHAASRIMLVWSSTLYEGCVSEGLDLEGCVCFHPARPYYDEWPSAVLLQAVLSVS